VKPSFQLNRSLSDFQAFLVKIGFQLGPELSHFWLIETGAFVFSSDMNPYKAITFTFIILFVLVHFPSSLSSLLRSDRSHTSCLLSRVSLLRSWYFFSWGAFFASRSKHRVGPVFWLCPCWCFLTTTSFASRSKLIQCCSPVFLRSLHD